MKKNDFGEKQKILYLIIGMPQLVDKNGKKSLELIFCVGERSLEQELLHISELRLYGIGRFEIKKKIQKITMKNQNQSQRKKRKNDFGKQDEENS
jgi:hypothetical protein